MLCHGRDCVVMLASWGPKRPETLSRIESDGRAEGWMGLELWEGDWQGLAVIRGTTASQL